MSTASPTAFLLWSILSVLFLGFLIFHLWSYDRFQCLRWSAGRQPGAFKRVMTYSYLGSVPLLVVYSVATTVIKYREGFITESLPEFRIMPRPVDMYSGETRKWVLPLNFVFSFAWALELVTHLEELAFWLYLLHQNPGKGEWFDSWEYRLWYCGSIVAICGMPLTCMIARRNLETVDAYIFLAGSSGSLSTTIAFLYVLWRFPRFIRHVKSEGADPTVVVRLATFYQLNLARIVFRFLFTVPLLMLAIDGITGSTHPLNSNLFSTDFLQMIAGVGCFVSSAITLLIFFPRSILREAGYKPRVTSTVPTSPKNDPVSPDFADGRFSPNASQLHQQVIMPRGWDGESIHEEVMMDADGSYQPYQPYPLEGLDEDEEENDEENQVPPYPNSNSSHQHSQSQGHSYGHGQSSYSSQQQSTSQIGSDKSLLQVHSHVQQVDVHPDPPLRRPVSMTASPRTQSQQLHGTHLHQRHPFTQTLSSPQLFSPPGSPGAPRVPPPVRQPPQLTDHGWARASLGQGRMEDVILHHPLSRSDSARPSVHILSNVPSTSFPEQAQAPAQPPRLHPYVMTFTSPIDLVDLSSPPP